MCVTPAISPQWNVPLPRRALQKGGIISERNNTQRPPQSISRNKASNQNKQHVQSLEKANVCTNRPESFSLTYKGVQHRHFSSELHKEIFVQATKTKSKFGVSAGALLSEDGHLPCNPKKEKKRKKASIVKADPMLNS